MTISSILQHKGYYIVLVLPKWAHGRKKAHLCHTTQDYHPCKKGKAPQSILQHKGGNDLNATCDKLKDSTSP